ncbi:unnamed protein product, partial [Urochloa humidicola]
PPLPCSPPRNHPPCLPSRRLLSRRPPASRVGLRCWPKPGPFPPPAWSRLDPCCPLGVRLLLAARPLLGARAPPRRPRRSPSPAPHCPLGSRLFFSVVVGELGAPQRQPCSRPGRSGDEEGREPSSIIPSSRSTTSRPSLSLDPSPLPRVGRLRSGGERLDRWRRAPGFLGAVVWRMGAGLKHGCGSYPLLPSLRALSFFKIMLCIRTKEELQMDCP